VKRTILLYALSLALLVFLLKMLEYTYVIRNLTLEFYLGVVALLFTVLGGWAGWKLTQKIAQPPYAHFVLNETALEKTGISKRELEVLELMSAGLSNQEIADKLFVSLNTVKTHTSNLFVKLDAKRRTQAIQRAKELQLIP
jgi:DNA-binding CsgD family transcriptional regulator